MKRVSLKVTSIQICHNLYLYPLQICDTLLIILELLINNLSNKAVIDLLRLVILNYLKDK